MKIKNKSLVVIVSFYSQHLATKTLSFLEIIRVRLHWILFDSEYRKHTYLKKKFLWKFSVYIWDSKVCRPTRVFPITYQQNVSQQKIALRCYRKCKWILKWLFHRVRNSFSLWTAPNLWPYPGFIFLNYLEWYVYTLI